MKKLFPHQITFCQADNHEGLAFIVAVGCKTFAYTDREKMITDFASYIRDPRGMSRQVLGYDPDADCVIGRDRGDR